MEQTVDGASLYEKIGGKDAVQAAVDIFYDKLLADDHLRHFFEAVNMERQKGKQRAFLTMAFGGPVNYEGKDLREGHQHLKLDDNHFNAVAGHLQETLDELGVPEELSGQVMQIAASTRDDVLNR